MLRPKFCPSVGQDQRDGGWWKEPGNDVHRLHPPTAVSVKLVVIFFSTLPSVFQSYLYSFSSLKPDPSLSSLHGSISLGSLPLLARIAADDLPGLQYPIRHGLIRRDIFYAGMAVKAIISFNESIYPPPRFLEIGKTAVGIGRAVLHRLENRIWEMSLHGLFWELPAHPGSCILITIHR